MSPPLLVVVVCALGTIGKAQELLLNSFCLSHKENSYLEGANILRSFYSSSYEECISACFDRGKANPSLRRLLIDDSDKCKAVTITRADTPMVSIIEIATRERVQNPQRKVNFCILFDEDSSSARLRPKPHQIAPVDTYEETDGCSAPEPAIGPRSWTNWAAWTTCSRSCGAGKTSRYRLCLAIRCRGPAKEIEACFADCSGGSRLPSAPDALAMALIARLLRPPAPTSPPLPIPATYAPASTPRPPQFSGERFLAHIRPGDISRLSDVETKPVRSPAPPFQAEPSLPQRNQEQPMLFSAEMNSITHRNKSVSLGPNVAPSPTSSFGSFNSLAKLSNPSKGREEYPWTAWSDCTSTCGRGSQTRVQPCVNCEGPRFEHQGCQLRLCPTVWGDWEAWGGCGASCGPGTRVRLRGRLCSGPTCHFRRPVPPPLPKGEWRVSVAGPVSERSACDSGLACPAEWVRWGPWTHCSSTCGRGEQIRLRLCKEGNSQCIGEDREAKACDSGSCERLTAHWKDWSPWSACQGSCGSGVGVRSRVCSATGHPEYCAGRGREARNCDLPVCTRYGPWSPFSDCSTTCGSGTRHRRRVCVQGTCDMPLDDFAGCKLRACPEPCLLSPWSEWSRCTASCGGGEQGRRRSCVCGFRIAGADECAAEDGGRPNSQRIACGAVPCPSWAAWESWEGCTASCGRGLRLRRRSCDGGGCPLEGRSERETCETPCSPWSEWGEWDDCSATCGTGFQIKRRHCVVGEGRRCEGANMVSRECVARECPTFDVWGEWSACSATCGQGSHTRRRACLINGVALSETTACGAENAEEAGCSLERCGIWSPWGIAKYYKPEDFPG